MTPKPEEKLVWAVGDDHKTVIIGIPRAAYEFLANGMTQTVDLEPLTGIPIRFVVYGGKDRAEVLKPLNIDKDTLDVSGIDPGFGRPD